MNKYEINSNTLALLSLDNLTTKVLEDNNIYIVNQSVKEIINHSCKYFGSSYLGRYEGTKEIIGINYKSPILIEESKYIIFFPTCSVRNKNCNWISLNKIKDYQRYKETSKVIFKNNIELILDISYGSLENQILRSTLLESKIRKRKNNL